MDNNNNINHNNTSNYNPPHSSADSSSSSSSINPSNPTNNRDQFLRHLNKLSHKISKPPNSNITINIPTSSSTHFKKPQLEGATLQPPPPPPPPPPQQQPPVYNINKSDFRDVVQKLTGSPAHAPSASSPATQPNAHAPKPASSRLQRIRPPPLVQLSTRPPPLLNCAVNPHSPLPPFPTCHAAAESPISAYMRFLNNSVSTVDSSINRTAQMPPPLPGAADSSGFFWLPSPKSPSPLLSPNLIFSPTGSGALGFPQLPLSPTMSGVPSPK